MPEYIEREAAIEEAIDAVDEWSGGYNPHCAAMIRDGINTIPAADVAPVRHGRWIDKPGGTYQRMQSWCSVCGKRSGIGGIENNRHKPFCPNCGAKMDGE